MPKGSRVISLFAANETLTFVDVASEPVPSLLRGFSAPVKLDFPYTRAQLVHLMAHDSDAFCRWEAGQTLMLQDLAGLIDDARQGRDLTTKHDFIEAMRRVLIDETLDPALVALMLTLPAETYLADQENEIDPDAIRTARNTMRLELARALRSELRQAHARVVDLGEYKFESSAVAKRSLKNVCLSYLSELDEAGLLEIVETQLQSANNMTDAQAALICLVNWPEGDAALQKFAQKWQGEALVMDKWFALQAESQRLGNVAHIKSLMQHPNFSLTNPNKVRSLLGTFVHSNLAGFHAQDGSGYQFAADSILALDKLNPQIASRLAGAFNRWKKLEPTRRALMQAQLERMAATVDLSRDVYEIVAKNLQ
jgi:aminopeptidase N